MDFRVVLGRQIVLLPAGLITVPLDIYLIYQANARMVPKLTMAANFPVPFLGVKTVLLCNK